MKAVVLAVSFLLVAVTAYAGSPYAVVGDYVEARSNEVYTCGCLFSGEQGTSGREAILAWDIRGGNHNGTSLAGTKVVAIVVGQANLEPATTSRKSVLYIDTTNSSAQQGVLNLFSREYGEVLGEVMAVRATPISFRMDEDQANVRLADTTLMVRKARLPEDAHPGSSQWYDPFIPMSQQSLAVTLHNEFWGEGFGLRWRMTYPPNITGFFGSFALAAE